MLAKKTYKKNILLNRHFAFAIFIFSIAILIITILAKFSYAKIINTVDSKNIYNNIFINNINVSNLSKQEALEKLKKNLSDPIEQKIIKLIGNHDDEYNFSFRDLHACYNLDDAVQEAYNYARNGNLINRYESIIKLKNNPVRISACYEFDREFVKSKISELESFVYIKPVNAFIKRENNKFIITPSKYGQKLNLEKALQDIIDLLEKKSDGEIILEFDQIAAQYDENILAQVKDLMGSFTTSFSLSEKNYSRNINIINATNKLNNTVIYPGEIFSINKTIRPYTQSNGYKNAPAIINGKVEDAIGGGICQVATVLYNAALYSELEITERQNHSMKVGYIDFGYDATLSDNYIDLKFKNTYDFPILIESFINNNNKIIINIYGKETRSTSRKISFENALIETIQPPAENIIYTQELFEDQKEIITKAKTGYKYKLYKIISENNITKNKILINTSYYKPIRGVIKIGTRKRPVVTQEIINTPEITPQVTIQPVEPEPEPEPEPTSLISQEPQEILDSCENN